MEKIELTYLSPDDNGNLRYKGTDGNIYIEIDGTIHDLTSQGEPLGPVYNTYIKKGEPVYNPNDRFARNPGSKIQTEVNIKLNEFILEEIKRLHTITILEEQKKHIENEIGLLNETKDVYDMYRKAGMEPPHPGKGIHTKKFHKCVTSVGKEDGKNPYAICMSSLGKDKAVKKSHQTESIEEEYDLSSFDYEDIPDLKGQAYDLFKKDLEKERKAVNTRFTEPHIESSEDEINNIINNLKQANLDLPNDKELIKTAEDLMGRRLKTFEIEKLRDKLGMFNDKFSLNESKRKQTIRKQIKSLIPEIDSNFTSDPRQISMARKILGDDSLIILNKLKQAEELSISEQEEARKNYLLDYVKVKANLSGMAKRVNPINIEDLEAIFQREGVVLDEYLKILAQKNSNVEQISDLERNSLLNSGDIDTPINADDYIAKKYIVKMLLNLDVPQEGDIKWQNDELENENNKDSLEIEKAYQIALVDNSFKEILERILSHKGQMNSKLFKKLKGISTPVSREKELAEGSRKSKFDHETYFNTLSETLDEMRRMAEVRGFEIDEDDIWKFFGTGGIRYETTNRASLRITDKLTGKEQRKMFHAAIYRMPSGKYELTAYIN